jgi:hypothetical protein
LISSPRSYLVIITQGADDGKTASPKVVVGQVPTDFAMDQSTQWHTPWGAGIAGEGTIGNLLALTGNRFVTQVQTVKIWKGSQEDTSFTVDFELRAWSDPVRDVLDPLRVLVGMSLPTLGKDGFLSSPGPSISPESFDQMGDDFSKAMPKMIKGTFNAITSAYEKIKDGKFIAVVSDLKKEGQEALGKIAKKGTLEGYMRNKISINVGGWFKLDNVVITQVSHTIKAQQTNAGLPVSAKVTVHFTPVFALTTDDLKDMFNDGLDGTRAL